jgi:signal peptidase I
VTEGVVRLQLLLLPPLVLALAGAAAAAGGGWLVLLAPAAVALTLHAQLVVRTGVRSWLPAAGTAALVCGGLAIVFFVVGPVLGLYQTRTVLSGSMRPTFGSGDVILVTRLRAEGVRVGDVISFHAPVAPHQVETHRVAAILRRGHEPIVETKGDANDSLDPWQAQLHGGTLWRYRLRVPLLGYPLLVLREPWVRDLTVLVLPALLALWGLARVWRPARPRVLEHA